MRSFLFKLLLLFLPSAALASDGVLEINQVCAESTGCFVGDSAGFPVTISLSGSYRLTSNLVIPVNTDGISLDSHGVSIDLSGFEIRGPGSCAGKPLVCSPSGSGSGLTSMSLTRCGGSDCYGTLVRNGSITGMVGWGVFVGPQSQVVGVRVRWNGIVGIAAGAFSVVTGNTAEQNGGTGITADLGSTISGNASARNAFDGIGVSGHCTITTNSVWQNDGDGIFANHGSHVSLNTSALNSGDGIETSIGTSVQGNVLRSNTGFGMRMGSQATYKDNTITANTAGTVTGTGRVNMGGNSCNGATTCP